jgi:orotate phosphoribosyltransferase
VAVVDDVVNAGSAVRATVAALRAGGAQPVGFGALLRLGDAVLPFAAELGLPVEALSTRPGVLREPRDCPACARGEPLEDAATG